MRAQKEREGKRRAYTRVHRKISKANSGIRMKKFRREIFLTAICFPFRMKNEISRACGSGNFTLELSSMHLYNSTPIFALFLP